jgi:RNA polymerase sigma factor (sigma-70 family)
VDVTSQAELVRAAMDGDQPALSTLFRTHRADAYAVAYAILGNSPYVEDLCQDAFISAACHLSDLREPEAFGGWLKAVVRNKCRSWLRANRSIPAGSMEKMSSLADVDDPGGLLARGERDWLWHGLNQLSPEVRLTVMLRYFTETSSYQGIAAVCGVPTGTVRSRLSEGRRQLHKLLLQTEEDHHDDVSLLARMRREEAVEFLTAGMQASPTASIRERCLPNTAVTWMRGRKSTGFEPVYQRLLAESRYGIGHRLINLVAGRDTTIWEIEFDNFDTSNFPKGLIWIYREKGQGFISSLRLFYQASPSVAIPEGADYAFGC